jgi:hypothetical protein
LIRIKTSGIILKAVNVLYQLLLQKIIGINSLNFIRCTGRCPKVIINHVGGQGVSIYQDNLGVNAFDISMGLP